MTTPVIAVIGAGNMGSSLVEGLVKHGHPVDKLWASDPSEEKLLILQNKFHIHTTIENAKALHAAQVVIFAIKPQLFAEVMPSIAPLIKQHKPLIISIAAGIRIQQIESWLGSDLAITRCMPNTPALIGCGATALCANANVSRAQHALAESLLKAVGVTVWVKEEPLMDVVTALSGSGPAYFFLVMESLEQAAVHLGLPLETAQLLTAQTAIGAARMAIESGQSLKSLRQQVTSPGGTTEKAVAVLEENNLQGIFKQALLAAKQHSEALAEGMKKK